MWSFSLPFFAPREVLRVPSSVRTDKQTQSPSSACCGGELQKEAGGGAGRSKRRLEYSSEDDEERRKESKVCVVQGESAAVVFERLGNSGIRRGSTAVDGDERGGKEEEVEVEEEGGDWPEKLEEEQTKEEVRKVAEGNNLNSSRIGWICMSFWFVLNIVMTIYGKALFSIYDFPYPLLLTSIHMAATAAGVFVLELFGLHHHRKISWSTAHRLLWFSLLFSANIWLSNASLMAVSIGLHQVVRTTIPLFTMVISLMCFGEVYPLRVLPSVLVVIAGVGFTMKGDLDFAVGPFLLVVLGCFFSSLKGILTQKTQVGSTGLSALDLLRYLCPLATVQMLVVAWGMGEVERCREAGGIQGGLWLHLPLMGLVFAHRTKRRCKCCIFPKLC
eukprot:GHVS01085946.1.p1 GENE.GHVS01085946.1~~GHVS01085946.1.p1  ORF type:complete len:388 (+),score=62.16 GHVS01085946.1:96-1259(+)